MSTPERCTRHKHLDPAAEWDADDTLDHFLNCLDVENQRMRWHGLWAMASAGQRCIRFDHQDQLDSFRRTVVESVHGQGPIPPADEPVPDMHVTVEWPGDRGQMQGVTYDRNGGPVADTLTPLDRRIVRALLEHALSQVPLPLEPVPMPYRAAASRVKRTGEPYVGGTS